MATLLSIPRLRWAAVLLAGLGWGEAVAQIAMAPNFRPAAGDPVPRRQASSDGGAQAKRIYFPPDPPPLGAQINLDPQRFRSSEVPRELGAYVTEAFYAPLSTCLTDFSVQSQRKFRPRLEAHVKTRDRLLAELRAVLTEQAGAPADVRAQEFAALAQRQAKALDALEAEAEALRAGLADKVSWFDLRAWKLGAGPLDPWLPEHRVLEFQVVRAAAFYQPGLRPVQRRLLREAAMVMQDEMFPDESTDTASKPAMAPRLVFFSPDLVRLLPLVDMPPAIVTRLEGFVAEKDALREELTAAIIAADKSRFAASRRRGFEKLAQAQAARLAALDERAEEIRRDYAPIFDRRRRPPPYALPVAVAARIDAFMSRLAQMLEAREESIRGTLRRVEAEYRGRDPRELRDLKLKKIEADIVLFSQENHGALHALDEELDTVYRALVACVGEAALATEGSTSAAFLTEYMARYRQAWAYYEYEIAVFEPALSPAQRRMLLGGAIRWLDLPLPHAEYQPMALPLTLLNEELKRPGARLR